MAKYVAYRESERVPYTVAEFGEIDYDERLCDGVLLFSDKEYEEFKYRADLFSWTIRKVGKKVQTEDEL